MNTCVTPESVVSLWDSAERPPFKGRLIDDDGCCCAQGQVLRLAGWADERLRSADQSAADTEVARLLGISRAHAVLLRVVNDRQDGCPQDVLRAPEKVLGPEARRVLAFWSRLDAMTAGQWAAAGAAARASWEIQGHSRLASFYFLPLFGIHSVTELDAATA